jgi:hypothetical protein
MAVDGAQPPAKADAHEKKPAGKGKKDEAKEAELSEEDQALKSNLELMVERLADTEPGVVKLSLTTMVSEIRSATATMTSVPKPLKFLRPQFDTLKSRFDAMPAEQAENRAMLADVLSILATTMELQREVLRYRLLGGTAELGIWGHEYIRHLSGEIAEEFRVRREADANASVDDLMALVRQLVPYHMSHNAEPEAVDLLLEVRARGCCCCCCCCLAGMCVCAALGQGLPACDPPQLSRFSLCVRTVHLRTPARSLPFRTPPVTPLASAAAGAATGAAAALCTPRAGCHLCPARQPAPPLTGARAHTPDYNRHVRRRWSHWTCSRRTWTPRTSRARACT